MKLAHEWSESSRTVDVSVSDEVTFSGMMLCDEVLQGLSVAGFRKPSPVQLQAIPIGRCGFDLIVEAKSGTGKTAVFSIISLEMIEIRPAVQVLILAPTREIAVQICEVIRTIGSAIKGLYVETVMGGTSCLDDIKRFSQNTIPQIVVGSPGRLRHLVQQNVIDTCAVRLLVLDEADKLMEGSFQADINYINSKLEKKQVIAASATYSEELRTFISRYMKSPSHVRPDNSCILLGVSQSITLVKRHENLLKQIEYKYTELKDIISSVNFKQCLVFCNYQARSKKICTMLKRDGWPAEYLSGCQTQVERLRGLRSLQEFKCRILVATDLAARGLDASNVDLVLNFEPPYEVATYLHRIGRAGRYGSYGSAITILSRGTEEEKFKAQIKSIEHSIQLTDFRSKSAVMLDEDDDNVKTEAKSSKHFQCVNSTVLYPEVSKKVEMELDFEELLDSFNNTKSISDTPYETNTEFPTFKPNKGDTMNLNKLSACVESLFNSYTDISQQFATALKDSTEENNINKNLSDVTSIDKLSFEAESLVRSCTNIDNLQNNNHVAEGIETQKAILNEIKVKKNDDMTILSYPEMSVSSYKGGSTPKRSTTKIKKMHIEKNKISDDEHENKRVTATENIKQLNGESLFNRISSSEDRKINVSINQTDGIVGFNNNVQYFANSLQTSDSEHEGPIRVKDKLEKSKSKPAGKMQRSTSSSHQYWDKIEQITTGLASMDYDAWRAQLAMMTAQIEQSVYISELCNQNI